MQNLDLNNNNNDRRMADDTMKIENSSQVASTIQFEFIDTNECTESNEISSTSAAGLVETHQNPEISSTGSTNELLTTQTSGEIPEIYERNVEVKGAHKLNQEKVADSPKFVLVSNSNNKASPKNRHQNAFKIPDNMESAADLEGSNEISGTSAEKTISNLSLVIEEGMRSIFGSSDSEQDINNRNFVGFQKYDARFSDLIPELNRAQTEEPSPAIDLNGKKDGNELDNLEEIEESGKN